MLTITITGNRGEGKTTLAARIIDDLLRDGHQVQYEQDGREETKILSWADRSSILFGDKLHKPVTIRVVDNPIEPDRRRD